MEPKIKDHPDFETFNRMITDMSVMQVRDGTAFTDQELAGDLTRVLLNHHEELPFETVATIAAIVACLSVRNMPADLRAAVLATPFERTH
jgi:hypothetical protein